SSGSGATCSASSRKFAAAMERCSPARTVSSSRREPSPPANLECRTLPKNVATPTAQAPAKPRPPAAEPRIDNRRARFEYEFLERFEVGVVLTGTEIKSIRAGGVSLNEAFARVRDGELWIV